MLTKIRRLKVKQPMESIFDKGEILYEYFDSPGYFYSEKMNNEFLNLKTMCQYVSFDELFYELKPIKKEKSPQYKLLIVK